MKRYIPGIVGVGLVLLLLGAGSVWIGSARAVQANRTPHAAFMPGDVFAGVGAGLIRHYDSTGTLIETLNTTSSSAEDTGMCFDSSGNLYATNWTAGNMTKFNN